MKAVRVLERDHHVERVPAQEDAERFMQGR